MLFLQFLPRFIEFITIKIRLKKPITGYNMSTIFEKPTKLKIKAINKTINDFIFKNCKSG